MSIKAQYLVSIEVERESGMFAGRDEISEAVMAELEGAPLEANLSSLGAQSNSEYTVVSVEVDEIDNQQIRDLWRVSQKRMLAELPGDEDLRREVKALRAEIRNKTEEIHKLLDAKDKRQAEHDKGATRIYIPAGYGTEELNQYLPDQRHDRIRFELGLWRHEPRADYVECSIEEINGKAVLQLHGSTALALKLNSSNVLYVAADR